MVSTILQNQWQQLDVPSSLGAPQFPALTEEVVVEHLAVTLKEEEETEKPR